MLNKWIVLSILVGAMAMAAPGEWPTLPGKLIAGQRVAVEHKGRIDRGIYSLSNANEIAITTSHEGLLVIPQAEVDRIILKGTDSPKLGYFGNAHDQLFPKPEIVYERAGAK